MSELNGLVNKQCSSEENLATFLSLCDLNADNPADWCQNLNSSLEEHVEAEATKLGVAVEEIPSLVEHLKKLNPNDDSIEWKYLCLNFHLLRQMQQSEFSVQQIASLKNVLRNLIAVGIASNLQPNLPYYTKLPGEDRRREDVFGPYKRLLGSVYGCCDLIESNQLLKSLLASNYLKWILCGFYQILYCPLMKPSSSARGPFMMTEAIYNSLMEEREALKGFFDKFTAQVHPVLYVRETMMLSNQTSPNWMKRALAINLNKVMSKPNGLECVARALLDASELDSNTESWKALDVIGKIVLDFYKFGNSKESICQQLLGLLRLRDADAKPIQNFERLFNLCTKLIFQEDEIRCEKLLINTLLEPLLCFTKAESELENEDVTESISQTMRLLCALVVEDNFNAFLIPVRVSLASLNVIIHIYSVTFEDNNFGDLNYNINSLLLKLLKDLPSDLHVTILDNLLFGFPCSNCLELRGFHFLVKSNALTANLQDHSVKIGPLGRAKLLETITTNDLLLKASLFTYLLNCLINREKYFRQDSPNRDLLQLESQFVLDEVAERNLAVFKLLSDLAEDKAVQKKIIENPTDVVRYICTVLNKSVGDEVHEEDASEGFQVLFLVVMLLQALVEITPKANLGHYDQVIGLLRVVSLESANDELKNLCKKILSGLLGEIKETESDDNLQTKSELEKAIEDICDPLLPVRGHGLMSLTKLVQKKDKSALERRRYVMNIFQENLKNDDSFIYLNAIKGLVAMGDLFPDEVLNVLVDEYSDFSQRDFEKNQEVRMKLGEVLVRVTKSLGESAPKYKAILLNSFLLGSKDDDHLIRASSLSNLGEICRVLGYKLGTSVTEILVCVHAIIATDKAPEARRAAVTVIRQLFVGLDKEMIVVLKDEILPIYRTLKSVYADDSDDIMKLQAQLALEQLNENMKDFIFPKPQLNAEKKVILLN